MSERGVGRSRRIWRCLGNALCVGILIFGAWVGDIIPLSLAADDVAPERLSAGVSVQQDQSAAMRSPRSVLVKPNRPNSQGINDSSGCAMYWNTMDKFLYYPPYAYFFEYASYQDWPNFGALEWYDGDWYWRWTGNAPLDTIVGNVGFCVFNDVFYVFFINYEGSLGYATLDPRTRQLSSPTYIGIPGGTGGCTATVCNGAIWIFTPEYVYTSSDGKNYSLFLNWWISPGFDPCAVLDAVTFYPMGDDPAQIMIIFNDTYKSPSLSVTIFEPTNVYPIVSTETLPWPPVNPYLWQPVSHGYLDLGTFGGYGDFPAGAKQPCVQFYGATQQGQDGYHQGRWEYNLTTKTWTFNDVTVANVERINVWPFFDNMDSSTGTMRLSHIIDYFDYDAGTESYYANRSDWMVPQYSDNNYAGMAENTATAAGTALQNLWTLVGVVLGPPPFPMNGSQTACPSPGPAFSWVDYGKDTTTTISTTTTASSTISVASESKIKGGIGQLNFDLSYAHGWQSSHSSSNSVSVSQFYEFGPCSETIQGTTGWAIFNAPTLFTQWYKLYAYDYDQSSGSGTYLNQDIYATMIGGGSLQTAYFDLANPSQGEYPGLFAGMRAYPNSTDISGWHLNVPDWNQGGSDWTVKFGDLSNPVMPVLSLGELDEVSYTTSNTTVDSKGNSNSFGISAGAKLSITGFSEEVTMGYDGEWTTTTENQSTITENVTCALNIARPAPDSGFVDSMTVQPYWLQAMTSNAPWLPTANTSINDQPWCITWKVTSFSTTVGTMAGKAAPPKSSIGTIRHGGESGKDFFSIGSGQMAWLNADGTRTPIPITADEFDVSKRAVVSINGHVFAATPTKGKWIRWGDIWQYFSPGSPQEERFSLSLNFRTGTWSLKVSSSTLDRKILAADGKLHVRLDVQNQYKFSTWLQHDVNANWSHTEAKSKWQPYGVHHVEGISDSKTQRGKVSIEGHIPKNVASFGDVEIEINGASVAFPLMRTKHFLDALNNHGQVSYKSKDLSFRIDFATGQWTATVGGGKFKSDMAPRNGAARVKILLGGKPLSDETFTIRQSTTSLRYAS